MIAWLKQPIHALRRAGFDVLTANDLRVLAIVAASIRSSGRQPTIRAIAERTGIAHSPTVHDSLRRLARFGMIERENRKHSALRLTCRLTESIA